MTVENANRFRSELEKAYKELFLLPEYDYQKGRTTPERLAYKMTSAFVSREANKEGEGVRRACKALGIPHTYKAIYAFLGV